MATRALVLGGGGPVGIAWESGLIAGLEEAGVALGGADRIVGTSAGSVVGAQLALGRSGAQLRTAQQTQSARPVQRAAGSGQATSAPDLSPLMKAMATRPQDPAALPAWRAGIGAFALQARTISEAAFATGFGALVGTAAWPAKEFICTAIDAHSGEFVTWSRDSGVPLGHAVASSCAVPGIYPPITIDGRRYYDGGIRSATNADLALGCDIVIVVSVMPAAAPPLSAALDAELAALRESGCQVALIAPDEGSRAAFGANLMDASRRLPALAAGFEQGRAAADQVRALWDASLTAAPR